MAASGSDDSVYMLTLETNKRGRWNQQMRKIINFYIEVKVRRREDKNRNMVSISLIIMQ